MLNQIVAHPLPSGQVEHPAVLPSDPLARQGSPLSPNDPTPYYLDCFQGWFHNHPTGAIGLLVQVEHSRNGVKPMVLKCEHCGEQWEIPPPPMKWSLNRENRVPEVMTRLKPTSDPWLWRCPERTRGDGRIYRIEFTSTKLSTSDKAVNRWTCTCRDWRDFQERFWACKHVRAVRLQIGRFLCDHQTRHEVIHMPDAELLPVGRPIQGNGWRGTLLTRCKDGVAYLEVQGVIHTAPHQQIWAELSKRGFEVADDCVWLDIAHEMGREGRAGM